MELVLYDTFARTSQLLLRYDPRRKMWDFTALASAPKAFAESGGGPVFGFMNNNNILQVLIQAVERFCRQLPGELLAFQTGQCNTQSCKITLSRESLTCNPPS